jgi:putative transposase
MLDELVGVFAPKVGVETACRAFAVNPRSWRYRRQRDEDRLPQRAQSEPTSRAPHRHPAALSDAEKDRIVEVLCSERFCDLAPAQVYSTLLDEGTYLCSERQMYRVLSERGLVRERRRGGHQRRGAHGVPRLEADRPNAVWSWDITKLKGPKRGEYYDLYVVLDIFSRYVVAWCVAPTESGELAKELIADAVLRHQVPPGQLTIHAVRGSSMTSIPVTELLTFLGIGRSHSRPHVCLFTGQCGGDQAVDAGSLWRTPA